MTTQEELQTAIAKAVARARGSDKKIAVGSLALRLSSAHPQSGATLDELCAKIHAEMQRQDGAEKKGDDR